MQTPTRPLWPAPDSRKYAASDPAPSIQFRIRELKIPADYCNAVWRGSHLLFKKLADGDRHRIVGLRPIPAEKEFFAFRFSQQRN